MPALDTWAQPQASVYPVPGWAGGSRDERTQNAKVMKKRTIPSSQRAGPSLFRPGQAQNAYEPARCKRDTARPSLWPSLARSRGPWSCNVPLHAGQTLAKHIECRACLQPFHLTTQHEHTKQGCRCCPLCQCQKGQQCEGGALRNA